LTLSPARYPQQAPIGEVHCPAANSQHRNGVGGLHPTEKNFHQAIEKTLEFLQTGFDANKLCKHLQRRFFIRCLREF
jgi:hypothetical protein